MKQFFTKFLLPALLFICLPGYATTWTTSSAGAVNTLSNWTNGVSSPTSFTTPGDVWVVNMSMTLGSGVTWTLGTATMTPDSLILTTGGTISVGGIPTTPVINIYGDFVINGGTLTMGGTAASEIVNVFGNTAISSGTINTPASSAHLFINTNGILTISGGTSGTNGSGASLTFNTTGTFNMTGGTINTPAAGAYDTVIVHGNFNMTGGSFACNGAGCKFMTKIYGNASISGPAALTCLPGNTSNMHLCLPRGSGTMLIDNTSTGAWSNTNVWIDSNCVAQLDGNFSTSTGGATYGLTVNGVLICPAADTVKGSDKFILNASGTLIVGHASGINGAIVNTGMQTFNDTANYGFNGTIAQVTGTLMPATLYAPDSIMIDNASGVTLSQSTATTGTLSFTSGILYTSANTMKTTGASTSVAGAGPTNFVNGLLIKTINGYTNINFEVGDTSYAPMMVMLNAAGTGGSIGATVKAGLHPSVGSSLLSPTHMVNDYWTLSTYSPAGPDTARIRGTYNLTDIISGTNAYFVTQEYTGSAWLGAPLASTNTSAPYSTAATPGIPLTTLPGDYIFGRQTTLLNTTALLTSGSISVFPNPGTGNFALSVYSDHNEDVKVVITNITGEVVKTQMCRTNNSTSIYLDAPAGVYLLSAASAHGSYMERIIIQ